MDPSYHSSLANDDGYSQSNHSFGTRNDQTAYYNGQRHGYQQYGQQQEPSGGFCGRLAQATAMAPWARTTTTTTSQYPNNNIESLHSQSQYMPHENGGLGANTSNTFNWHAEFSNADSSTRLQQLPTDEVCYKAVPELPWYQCKKKKRRKRHTLPGPAGILPSSSSQRKQGLNSKEKMKDKNSNNDNKDESDSDSNCDEDDDTWSSKIRKSKKLRHTAMSNNEYSHYENIHYWQHCIFNHPAWWKMCSSLERYIPCDKTTVPFKTSPETNQHIPLSSLLSLRDLVSSEYTLLSQVYSHNLITVPLMAVLMTTNPIDLTKEGGGSIRSNATSYFTLPGSSQGGQSLILCHVMDDSSLTSGIVAMGWAEESIFNDDFDRCHRTQNSSTGLSKNQRQHGVIVVLLKNIPVMVLPKGSKEDDESCSVGQGEAGPLSTTGDGTSPLNQGAIDVDRILLISSDHVICRWTNEADTAMEDGGEDDITDDDGDFINVAAGVAAEQRRRFNRFLYQGQKDLLDEKTATPRKSSKSYGADTETSSLTVFVEQPGKSDGSPLSICIGDEKNEGNKSTNADENPDLENGDTACRYTTDPQIDRPGAENVLEHDDPTTSGPCVPSDKANSTTINNTKKVRKDSDTTTTFKSKQPPLPESTAQKLHADGPCIDNSREATNEDVQASEHEGSSSGTGSQNLGQVSASPKRACLSSSYIAYIQETQPMSAHMKRASTRNEQSEITFTQEQKDKPNSEILSSPFDQQKADRESINIDGNDNNPTNISPLHDQGQGIQHDTGHNNLDDAKDYDRSPPSKVDCVQKSGFSPTSAPSIWKPSEGMLQDDLPYLSCTQAIGQSISSNEDVEEKPNNNVREEEGCSLFTAKPSSGLFFSTANDTPLEDLELDDDLSLEE